jgi:hypothetical protein
VDSVISDVDLLMALVHMDSDSDYSTALTRFGFMIIFRTNHHENHREPDDISLNSRQNQKA